jgi:hypothetical protein
VIALQGACGHAAAFGAVGQTLEEAWTLTEAALDAANVEGTWRPLWATRSP